MRIGVLGAGRIGRAHAANLMLVERVDEVCVHDPNPAVDPGGPQPVDPYPTFPVRFHAAYLAEVEAFAALVAGTGPNRSPGQAAVDALRLAVAADRSLATGLPVAVADITA